MPVRQKDYAFLVAFASATFLSIVFMTVFLPSLVFQPDVTKFSINLDEKELRGREIYKREGCWYCHSQFVRPQDRNEGPVALAGDFEFTPETRELAKRTGTQLTHLLGTERTGPDLSSIGGRYPDAWHKAHHRNPQAFNPGSVMSSFSYLSEEDMDDLVAYLQTLGREKNRRAREYEERFKGNHNLAYTEAPAEGEEVAPSYFIEPEVPWEFKRFFEHEFKNNNPVRYENRYIAGARGIYNNKCAHCHGVQGDGNGPRNQALTERPVNFQSNDPNMDYDSWSDIKWFWKISEGAGPGAVMPRWNGVLSPEQIWYLVTYCKYLAADRTMPNAPRWDPMNPDGGPTFWFTDEAGHLTDDLQWAIQAPEAPVETPTVDPGLTPIEVAPTGGPAPMDSEAVPAPVTEEMASDETPAEAATPSDSGEEVPAGGGYQPPA